MLFQTNVFDSNIQSLFLDDFRVTNNQRIPPRKQRNGPQIDWCIHPLKLKPVPGPIVALASFPGSGNTWLRYLIQQASGYLTGSVYKDYALLKNGFPAESVANGSVLVVKTHEFGPEARSKFDRVILLVRDPFASLKAEFNRRSGGHTGHASPARYSHRLISYKLERSNLEELFWSGSERVNNS